MTIHSAIRSEGAVESQPTEIYGTGDVVLRIGNGGAGATGLIKALAYDYLSTKAESVAISWVCNHSRNTQLALLQGHVDLALTYERDQERLSIAEGWAESAGCVFHDHFCLVGPSSDPLNIRSCSSIAEALMRLARRRGLFHSRADFSATMFKERSLWRAAGLWPWEWETSDWYKTSKATPAEALIKADHDGAYLLTDRSTILRQTAEGTLDKVRVLFEPSGPDDVLMNSCHALYSATTKLQKDTELAAFLTYLQSDRGQQVISDFGNDEVGSPMFAKVKDGYSQVKLLRGRPQGGKWVLQANL